MLEEVVMLDGESVIVETDENKFGSQKYHTGKRIEGKWLFSLFERGADNRMFRVVESRDAESLLKILNQHQLLLPTVEKPTTASSPNTQVYVIKIRKQVRIPTVLKGFGELFSLRGTRQAALQFDSYLAEYM
ncbi:hypothetical protein X975_02480, partial [Stegodyphus mimosarum]